VQSHRLNHWYASPLYDHGGSTTCTVHLWPLPDGCQQSVGIEFVQDLQDPDQAFAVGIDSDMQVPGLLAKAVQAVASKNISILAVHQTMRQVDMQFIVNEADFDETVKSFHASLVEVHGRAICFASWH